MEQQMLLDLSEKVASLQCQFNWLRDNIWEQDTEIEWLRDDLSELEDCVFNDDIEEDSVDDIEEDSVAVGKPSG